MAGEEDYVLDMHFADWVWRHIKSSPRVYWPADEKLQYRVKAGLSADTYYRDGTWSKEVERDWQKQGGVGAPDWVGSPVVDFHDGKVSEVMLAGTPYTIIGSWYTFEMTEKEGEPATVNPLRVPVPDQMIQDVRDWARDNRGEVTRTKGVEFKERWVEGFDESEASFMSSNLNDVHVKFEGVERQARAKELFREATDFAERGVRAVV